MINKVRSGLCAPDGEGQEAVALDTLIGDVTGQEVCDLACGQGKIARWLARRRPDQVHRVHKVGRGPIAAQRRG